MVYADYIYYATTYSGNAIAETDFMRMSRQASAFLDSITFGKVCRGDWPNDERVKNACCAIAEMMFKREQGGEVASESNDGASVTYVSSSKTPEQQMYDVAVMYLSSTGLLYAGVM